MPHTPQGPFVCHRIADDRFPLLDGGGSLHADGRWHSRGRWVIYTGMGYATALLEKLVRTRTGRVPTGQQCGEIFIPSKVSAEEVATADMPGWNRADAADSRAYGNAWYDSARTAVLIVPSVPAMGRERNLLINQMHPDFAHIHHGEPFEVVWDARLFL